MVSLLRYAAGALLLVAVFVLAGPSEAQDGKGEKVRINTVDGVELHGVFYAGKRNAATILMLHPLNEDSRKKAWVSLAEALNKEGFSVLTFDFRAHGQSKTVDPDVFWKIAANRQVKGWEKKKTEIEYKDLGTSYYPVLVNDIAAVKAFLDNRNDSGACNTSSFMLLGAESGAALGAIWLNAEWKRYSYLPPNLMLGMPAQYGKNPEGKNVIAAVWLSPSNKLGSTRVVSLTNLLVPPARDNGTPMYFLYSEEDPASKATCKSLEKSIKGIAKKTDEKYRYTAAVGIKGGGKLTGMNLLQKSLGTDDAIVEYVKNVNEAKGNEWEEREFRKNQYVWMMGKTPVPAKLPKESNLVFDNYEKFVK